MTVWKKIDVLLWMKMTFSPASRHASLNMQLTLKENEGRHVIKFVQFN